MKIGVLALQGDFDLHRKALARCGVDSVEVRKPAQLADLDEAREKVLLSTRG